MTFRSAPSIISELKAMLGNCSAWTGAGGAAGQIIYPNVVSDVDTTFPRVILGHLTDRNRIGTSMSLETGSLMMILQGYGRWSDDITAIDATAQTITVAGDISSQVSAGDEFYVAGSTDNDGWYVVTSVAATTSTVITVDETKGASIQSDTADGTVRLAAVESAEPPEEWLAANGVEAQALVDGGRGRNAFTIRQEAKNFVADNPGALQLIDLGPDDLEAAIEGRTAAQETLLLKTLSFAIRLLYVELQEN